MRTIGTALGLAVILLAGCSTVQPLAEVSATRTTLPMPSGATTVPWASGAAVESCDATASLRPSTVGGAADALGIVFDRHVTAALNGDQITHDGTTPLAAGDAVFFLSADAGG